MITVETFSVGLGFGYLIKKDGQIIHEQPFDSNNGTYTFSTESQALEAGFVMQVEYTSLPIEPTPEIL